MGWTTKDSLIDSWQGRDFSLLKTVKTSSVDTYSLLFRDSSMMGEMGRA
jgi:hypothetical protein